MFIDAEIAIRHQFQVEILLCSLYRHSI